MLILAFYKSKNIIGKPTYSRVGVLIEDEIYTVPKFSSKLIAEKASLSEWDYVVIYGLDKEQFLEHIDGASVNSSINLINDILQLSKEKPTAKIKDINKIVKFLLDKGHSILTFGSDEYYPIMAGYK